MIPVLVKSVWLRNICFSNVQIYRLFVITGNYGRRSFSKYGILFRSEFFFRTTRELEHLFFSSRNAQIFFQNLTLGYMTKILKQIIFFSSSKIRIFFSATFFLKKKPYTLIQLIYSI